WTRKHGNTKTRKTFCANGSFRGFVVSRFRATTGASSWYRRLLLIQLTASIGRHVGHGRVLRELQRANVGDDRPAILRADLRRVVGHYGEAVRHHLKEMADRGVAEPVLVEGQRAPIAAPNDHAVADSRPAVARRAVDVEPLAPARHHLLVDRERE